MVNSDHVALRTTLVNPIYLRNAMIGLMTRPQEDSMSTDVALPTPAEVDVPVAVKKFKPVETDIDHLGDRMARLRQARLDRDTLAAFIEMEERSIKDELAKRGATDGRINGVVVVTHRPRDSYRLAEFRDAYPEIYAKYLEPEIVDVLNKSRLISDHRGLLEDFRSTAFNIK